MRNFILLIITLSIFQTAFALKVLSQNVVPGEKIKDLKLGGEMIDIKWILGFEGEINENIDSLRAVIPVDFTEHRIFNYIMSIPVSSITITEGSITGITISNIQEYNKIIAEDYKTEEGIGFFNSPEEVKQAYGENEIITQDDIAYLVYEDKGISFGFIDDELRVISVFKK